MLVPGWHKFEHFSRLNSGFYVHCPFSFIQMTTETKSYATFNTVTFEANVFNVDVVDGQYGEYAAITLIGNFATDDEGFTIRFKQQQRTA